MTNDPGGVSGGSTGAVSQAEQALLELDELIREQWRKPSNARVRSACDDVYLAAKFVLGILQPHNVAARIKDAVRHDDNYATALEMIRSTTKEFDACLGAIEQAGSERRLVEKLVRLADELRQELDWAIGAFVTVVNALPTNTAKSVGERRRALDFADGINSRLQARRFIHEAAQALDETRQARDEAKMAAGETGSNVMVEAYESYAKKEMRTAEVLRFTVAILLVAVAAGAIWLNIWLGPASLAVELIRLSATIPIAALASYLAHESSKHRTAAKRTRELAVEMRALPAYTEQLAPEDRRELFRTFGTRVFGTPADQVTATPAEPGLFDEPMKTLDKAMELLGRVRDTVERRTNAR